MRKLFSKPTTLLLYLGIIVSFFQCSDPTEIGGELLDEDLPEIVFVDTITLEATTVEGEMLKTYSPDQQLRTYYFGNYNDPVFGQVKSGIYVQPRLLLQSLSTVFGITYDTASSFELRDIAQLDSAVLVLMYDTTSYQSYGNIDGTFGIEAYQLTELDPSSDTIFANQSFATDGVSILDPSYKSFVPNFNDVSVSNYTVEDTVLVDTFPQLRLHLNNDYVNSLISLDTSILQNDTLFLEQFPGLYLEPTTETGGLVAFELYPRNSGFVAEVSGIHLYYQTNEGDTSQYRFPINELSFKSVSMNHDYTGSTVGNFLSNSSQNSNDSLIFIQGLAGVDTKITIPNIEKIENAIVNKAELIVTIADVNGLDTSTYSLPDQLALTYDNGGTYRSFIDDIQVQLLREQIIAPEFSIPFYFEGFPNTEDSPVTYTMNISSHIQGIIDGDIPNEIFLTAYPEPSSSRFSSAFNSTFPKAERASRVALYGTGHPEFSVKLRVTYTSFN